MKTSYLAFFLFWLFVKFGASQTVPAPLPLPGLKPIKSGIPFSSYLDRPRLPPRTIYPPLPTVVVTAQRMDSDYTKTPASISTTWAGMERRTVPEALSSTPGVFVQKTNHGGGSPFLRGLTGNQTLLLVDGIRLSNATFRYGPNQYLNTVDPYSVSSIEVLKGGGSVGYGSDALGGTVNVFSKKLYFSDERQRRWTNKVSSFWRSQNMEKTGHAETGFSGKTLAFFAGGTFRKFGDLVGGDTTGVQKPTGYDEAAFDLKGKLRLGSNATLTVAHQFFRQTDVPIFHKIQLENFARNHVTRQQRQLSYARFEWLAPHLGKVWQPLQVPARSLKTGLQKITATASLHRTDEERESQKNGSPTLRKESDEVRSLGASVLAEFTVAEWWRSTVGLEAYHDLVGSRRTDVDTDTGSEASNRGLYPDGATHQSAAIFCTNEWETGDWNFTGGLRFNHFSIKTEDDNIGKTHLTPNALVWNAGALRRMNRFNSTFASINSAFRAPNVDDLGSLGIVDFRYEVPTADLRPEKSYNFELGWRQKRERWGTEVAVFRNELRDLITRVRVGTDSIAGYPVYQKENVQRGFVQGVEVSSWLSLPKNLGLRGNLAWQCGQNVTDGEPLRRIPPMFGGLMLIYEDKKQRALGKQASYYWWALIEWNFASKQDRLATGDKADNRIPAGGTPGWQVVNIYARWSISVNDGAYLVLKPGIWNILNADYRYHGSGVNGIGRSVSLGATVTF
ncbi:MAG: TonB-dependent receptor [Saprospiraceae bacterium]|nr:TonB-dependent receptor [Saprospiraceae bacterium]MCF8250523.1 TonB-dependent receptor [Saprospiraceae bacterium]MCF8279663.1 TonB-dependent receptor [Bacteroidales bacterium]MCF8312449.1 TonB-dependent receptor [Saprospiraceae bacterium]MCF8440734.1 TonB-dependent receptor [Saprospiraceae bacterium]